MPTPESRSDYIRHWGYRRDPATLHRFVERIGQAVPHLLPQQPGALLDALSVIIEGNRAVAQDGTDAA